MKRIAIAVLLALAACNPAPEQKVEEAPAVAAPNIGIGPDGAAGISAALPLTTEAITAAAPHFDVAEAQDQVEGQPYRLITLSAGGEIVFRLLPTSDGAHVHAITTRSTRARGPNLEVIGAAKFGEAPATQVMFCLSEYVDGAAGFACSTAADGRFWRIYSLPETYRGPTEPFANIDPDAALEATLAEMRWFAPRVAQQN